MQKVLTALACGRSVAGGMLLKMGCVCWQLCDLLRLFVERTSTMGMI